MSNQGDIDQRNNREEDPTTYEVLLARYTLSYSASCPAIISTWVHLFEKIAPTSWLSHYALIIGAYRFDLKREGWLPFASTATFRAVNTRNLGHGFGLYDNEPRWIGEDLRLGTTTLSPDSVISTRMPHPLCFLCTD